jgi:hypothetical protein
MAIKRELTTSVMQKSLFFTVLFFSFMVPAETIETGIEQFIQRLDWEADEYARNYEVTVEKLLDSAGEYTELLRRKTEDTFLDCSLTRGQYRYRVQVYDLFNRPQDISEWSYFEVIPLLRPPVSLVTNEFADTLVPEGSFIHHLGWQPAEYTYYYETVVEKQNDDEVYRELLRKRTNGTEVACALAPGRYRYQVTAYGFFERPGNISEWSYFEVIAPPVAPPVAPPADEPPITQSAKPPLQRDWDFFAELVYLPLFSLPNSDFNRLYTMDFLPLGFSARLGFVPLKGPVSSLGLELIPSWAYLKSETDDYSVYTQLMGLHLGLVWGLWLPNNRMAFNFRLGGGLSLLYDFHFEYGGKRDGGYITTWIPSAHGGISFLWFYSQAFFVEIGADFMHLFSTDAMFLEFVRPSLGVGVRF